MTALAYVTIDTPHRRLDVALPAQTPIAEVMSLLVRHGGVDLAQRGLAHGGWSLRRADGIVLAAGETLSDQGVRDGEVLSLVHADRLWARIAYDDVAIAVQESPDRGMRWAPNASRTAGVVAGVLVVVAGCLAALRSASAGAASGAALAGLALTGLAAVALGIAALLARGNDDVDGGAGVAITGLPVAMAAGFLIGAAGSNGSSGLAAAGVAALVYALTATLAVGRVRAAFLAGSVFGAAAIAGSIVWVLSSLPGAAATTAGMAAIGGGVAPALGVRFGGLPGQRGLAAPDRATGMPENWKLFARALARTDEVILGLLAGLAVVAAACGIVLGAVGGWPALALGGVCGLAFGLRARGYTVAAHRAAGLVAAAAIAFPAVVTAAWQGTSGLAVTVALTACGLLTVVTVTLCVTRASGSPYVARVAEFLELTALAAIVPLVCVNLGAFWPLIGA